MSGPSRYLLGFKQTKREVCKVKRPPVKLLPRFLPPKRVSRYRPVKKPLLQLRI